MHETTKHRICFLMVHQWLCWLCAYFYKGLYTTSNSGFRNVISRICFNWLWKDELSQSNGPTALFPAQYEVTNGRNYLSGGCLEPWEGHRHTYPLTAGLNTLSNTHSKRERQQERQKQKESKERKKKKTVKIAEKTEELTLQPYPQAVLLPGEHAGTFQKLSQRVQSLNVAFST